MYLLIKRFLDFICAIIALLLFSPIIIVAAIVLAVVNRGSPFFFQKRPGKNTKIFSIVKFKSMKDTKDENGKLLPDHLRITRAGRFIRRSSIDELPQLFNVVLGDMSIVGPRPLRVSYLEYYSKEQNKRHNVRPGISGWAQVNGRNMLSHTEKFKLDVWYVENLGFKLDICIILKTMKKVFIKEGIEDSGVNLTEPFNGKN